MNTNYNNLDKLLNLEITEELDHHTTDKIRRRADYEIQRHMPRKVIFDFNKVTFMDSAGIGMLLGRYKLAKTLGAETYIKNVSNSVKKILTMSGVLKIITNIDEEEKNKIEV